MDIEDILKQKKKLSPEELADLLDIARDTGRTAFITVVDDPKSPEAKEAAAYIRGHRLLPKNFMDTTEAEIEEKGKKLLHSRTSIKEKKKILMLLAHQGVYESYRILKAYHQNPDPKLAHWAGMALDECKTFVRQMFSPEALVAFQELRKTGRNDPCPCGSGKKFKACCGMST
ncbi:MAG: SEC-C metal-binding domain-containing protein [bacterium]